MKTITVTFKNKESWFKPETCVNSFECENEMVTYFKECFEGHPDTLLVEVETKITETVFRKE